MNGFLNRFPQKETTQTGWQQIIRRALYGEQRIVVTSFVRSSRIFGAGKGLWCYCDEMLMRIAARFNRTLRIVVSSCVCPSLRLLNGCFRLQKFSPVFPKVAPLSNSSLASPRALLPLSDADEAESPPSALWAWSGPTYSEVREFRQCFWVFEGTPTREEECRAAAAWVPSSPHCFPRSLSFFLRRSIVVELLWASSPLSSGFQASKRKRKVEETGVSSLYLLQKQDTELTAGSTGLRGRGECCLAGDDDQDDGAWINSFRYSSSHQILSRRFLIQVKVPADSFTDSPTSPRKMCWTKEVDWNVFYHVSM